MNIILGAGISGLSCSYHLGHANCLVLEEQSYAGGHIRSRTSDGFTWDEGPHVSFTRNPYVQQLFAASVQDEYSAYCVRVANYYHGSWIDHPAQCSLHQLPEPLRTRCLSSFLEAQSAAQLAAPPSPANYGEWLQQSLGPVFASELSELYTRKFWTIPSDELATKWVGTRVHAPSMEDVMAGYKGLPVAAQHYILNVRYPKRGGYNAFSRLLRKDCNLRLNSKVTRINLSERTVHTASGESFAYTRLINTMPLPVFISLCDDVPPAVAAAAQSLLCTRLLLVNMRAHHATQRPENWSYVYDADKLTTRLHFVEKLTPGNAPPGWTGIQVEVYESRLKPFTLSYDEIGGRVVDELIEMGLIVPAKLANPDDLYFDTHYLPWANPAFTHGTAPALQTIWTWLEQHNLYREEDDTHPLTQWSDAQPAPARDSTLFMAGRFGQWKYYWSDDCVLRGRHLAAAINA